MKGLEEQYERISRSRFPAGKQWLYAVVRSARRQDENILAIAMAQFEQLTPEEILNLFPPTKIYQGERYQMKDYFSTMKSVSEYSSTEPIGARSFEFLWDYVNWHTSEFLVSYMSALSNIRRRETGIGIFEEFLDGMGVDSFTEEPGYGAGVMINSRTGEVVKTRPVKTRVPKWWRVIKGGKSN